MKGQNPSLEASGSTFTGPGWMEESGSRAQIWSRKTQITANGDILPYQKNPQHFYLTVLSPGFISSLLGSPPRCYTLTPRPINRVWDGFIAILAENMTYHKKNYLPCVNLIYDRGSLTLPVMAVITQRSDDSVFSKMLVTYQVIGRKDWCRRVEKEVRGAVIKEWNAVICGRDFISVVQVCFFFKICRSMTSDTVYFSLP